LARAASSVCSTHADDPAARALIAECTTCHAASARPGAAPRQSRFLRLDKRSSHDGWVVCGRCTFERKCGCAQSHWSEHAQPHRKCFEPYGARHGASWYAVSITLAAVRPCRCVGTFKRPTAAVHLLRCLPRVGAAGLRRKGPRRSLAHDQLRAPSAAELFIERTSRPTDEHDERRPIGTGVVTRRGGRGRGGGRCRRSPPGEACAPLRYIAPL
jgi:hypothetical protein